MGLGLVGDDDARIAERIANGDADAEAELVRRFRPGLLAVLRFRTRDPELAQDLTQEVLISAIRSLRDGRLRQGERLAGYLHAIARNHLASHGRREARRPRALPLEHAGDLAGPDEARARENRQLAAQALAGVEPLDRQILELALVECLKPAEIAARLGLTPEAVGMRRLRALRRAASRMRESLASGRPQRLTK